MPTSEPVNACPAGVGRSGDVFSLRRAQPVCRIRLPTGSLAWLVTAWADARFVLSDPRFSKAALTEPDAPKARPGALPPGVLFTTDPPEHTALRTLLSRGLTPARVASLRPRVVSFADELNSALETPADLVSGYAEPFSMRSICALLDVPVAEQAQFASWSATVLAVSGQSPHAVESAQRELLAYIARLVAARSAAPGDDLVSDLLRHSTFAGYGPIVGLVATLLVTGYETMVAAVANSALALLTHGGLVREPTPSMLEELFRFAAFGDALRSRRAVRDVRMGSAQIRAGDLVVVSTAAANRDSAVFVAGESFLPTRNPNPHMAFGRGVHFCAGAGLARTQLQVALSRLALHHPRMRLAVPLSEITLRVGASEAPPERLPVTW